MFKNILKGLAIATIYGATIVKADSALINKNAANGVTLEYTKEGVLRKDNNCNVNFINFGIKNDIINISVQKEKNKNGSFNLKIGNLKNGNEGLNRPNSGYTFTNEEIKDYIKISQNDDKIDDFKIASATNGQFSLTVKNLTSCNGLTIKQTFKEPVIIATYLLYSNDKPKDINHSFNIAEFGPSSNNVPYDTLHWDMNTGLDDIREKCRIYIDYMDRNNVASNHWIWYLSTDSINGEKCDNAAFFKTVKKSYVDYDVMDELFGDYYEGYVIKREGEDKGHMDGILVNQKYLIEIYQNECNEQNKDQVICTISSNKKLTFQKFQDEFVANCLNVLINQDEEAEWKVNDEGVKAIFSRYALNIVNYNRGSLPKTENDSVSYKEFKAAHSSGIARFSVNLECNDGSYIGDKCRCNACPANCSKCLNENTCTKCNEGSVLVDGQCVCEIGYKKDNEGVCIVSPTETASIIIDPTETASIIIDPIETASIIIDPTDTTSTIIGPTETASIIIDPTEAASIINEPITTINEEEITETALTNESSSEEATETVEEDKDEKETIDINEMPKKKVITKYIMKPVKTVRKCYVKG